MPHDDVQDADAVTGSDKAAAELRKYLVEVRQSPEIEGEITFTLYQKAKAKRDDEEIQEFEFSPTSDVEQMIEEVVDVAEEYILSLSAPTVRFCLRTETLVRTCIFTLKMPKDEEDYEDIDDMPNRKGLMGLLMRHQHAEFTDIRKDRRTFIDMLRMENERKDKYIAQLEARVMDAFKAMEDLSSGTHIRNMELRKQEANEQRKDKVAGVIVNAFPMLVGKFMGGPEGAAKMAQSPGARTVVEQMLEGLVASMNQEQLEKIATSGIFSMEQIMALKEIIIFIIQRRQAEQAPPAGQNGAAAQPEGATPSAST